MPLGLARAYHRHLFHRQPTGPELLGVFLEDLAPAYQR